MTLTGTAGPSPVHFNYRISNGLAEAEGVITVVEIPHPGDDCSRRSRPTTP